MLGRWNNRRIGETLPKESGVRQDFSLVDGRALGVDPNVEFVSMGERKRALVQPRLELYIVGKRTIELEANRVVGS